MNCEYEFKEGSQVIFDFLEMSPSPPLKGPRQTYLTRTNVDGEAVWKDGNRGRLFALRTIRDELTVASGKALMDLYAAKQGSVIEINYKGVIWGSYLIDDQVSNGFEVLKIVGGLAGDSKFLIETEWQLLQQ